jgi:hypothetical protein
MDSRGAKLSVQITRLVDESFPGWVACEFDDAHGIRHTIVDKAPTFTTETLDGTSLYPRPGSAPCKVAERWQDRHGRELVRITIADMDSAEGLSECIVVATQLL